MNNLISKIVGVCLGLSLATGVGVGVAAGNQEVKAAYAADSVTVTFADQGWTNSSTHATFTVSNFTFTKSGSGNAPAYYTSDSTLRYYNGNILTITPVANSGYTINSVSSNPSQTFSVSNNAATVSFSATVKFKSITISYTSGALTPEPSLVTGQDLSDLYSDTSGNGKQLYEVTGFVTNWASGKSDGTQFGNFYLAETSGGTPEYYVYGATETASALSWNGSTGEYVFTNPKNFLTGTLTSTIAIGDEVTMKLTRCDYTNNGVTTKETNGIVTNVVKHSSTYPEPALVTGEDLSDLFADTSGNFKQLYEVTGYVSKWKSGETNGTQYGNFYLTETDSGGTEYYIYGATETTSALSWNANTGAYSFTNPQNFLTGTLTKTIVVGSQVTMKLTRNDYDASNLRASGIVTNVVNPPVVPDALGDSLIIEPDYLGLTTTGISSTDGETLTGTNNYTYKAAPSANKVVKKTTPNNGGVNLFDSQKQVILIGQNGAYLYNTIAYEKKISKLELYSANGASTSVQVAVGFATEAAGPITSSISTNVKTLSTADSVYDYSLSGMLDANYRYFRIQVCSAHNAQLQIKLTFADDSQQAVDLNSITLSHADLVNGVLPVPLGTNKTLSVSFDPTNASDQTLTWSTSNSSVASVTDGVISVPKTATINDTATITATPTDTHAQAQSITVRVSSAVVASVDMRNGMQNNKTDNRFVVYTDQGLSVWPENAIKVTYSDDTVIYPDYDDTNIVWYYNNSDDNNNDVEISDISTFLFQTGMKRMRLSYMGVMADARTYITVNEGPAPITDFIVSGTVSGNNDFYVEDIGTIVVKAPAGYTICTCAYDSDRYFEVEDEFEYDAQSQTFTGTFAVSANTAQVDVVVGFYLYSSDYSDYLLHNETIQIINPSGLANARAFAKFINQVCANPTASNWENLENDKWSDLSSDAKAFLTGATYTLNGDDVTKGDDTHYEIAEAMSRYDYMVKTYNFDNFMQRSIESNIIRPFNMNADSDVITVVIIVLSITSATAIGAYFFLRKKKEVK